MRRFLLLLALHISILAALLPILGLLPSPSFDDIFMKENNLLPYFDFRPGYPPLSKLPQYFIHGLSAGSPSYSLLMFLVNLLGLSMVGIGLYLNISKAHPERASVMTLLVLAMPSVIYYTLVYSHADSFAIFAMLLAIYFVESAWLSGALTSVGVLLKLFPVVLILPLVVYLKGLKTKITLLYSFALVLLVVSTPFLLNDPLMYTSVAFSHFLRGPSESIFSVIDGYFGHTGFVHPTFDAAIYSWQYADVYAPSAYDHHRYQWHTPALSYISLALQVISLTYFGWIAKGKRGRKDVATPISLAVFSFFAFSTFFNPIIHVIQLPLLTLATLSWKRSAQIATITLFESLNVVHSIIWFSPVFWFIGTALPLLTVVCLRLVFYGAAFVMFSRKGNL